MSKKVLLTGISGFVGQHCAVALLKKGYHVKGSLRSLKKKDEVLMGIKKEIDPKDKLEFCVLNLNEDAGWHEAMEGCDYVLHVASPFFISEPKDPQEMIKPAVEGTLRALKAAKANKIKKVVVTSSTVAMAGDKKTVKINQNSWSDANSPKLSAYIKSKTMAEKAVWDFYNEQNDQDKMEITVVNPGPIYGPTLTGNLSGASMDMIKKIITGQMPQVPNCTYVMSDVRDVAHIHVEALENEKSNGNRYIVTSPKAYSFVELTTILKENGFDKASNKKAPSFLLKFLSNFNSELKGMRPLIDAHVEADTKATQDTFNWKATPFEKTVLDTGNSIKHFL